MYKLAFIGGSINSIAGYPHFVACQMDKRFEVVAGVFSTDDEINQKTGIMWNIKNIYKDYKSLIRAEKSTIDAIVILTPTPNHCEIIIELLKNEIPIICEKPLVSSVEEIKKINIIYNPKKHFLVVTNNYSGYPMIRELKKRIEDRGFGDILHYRFRMAQESFLREHKNILYPQKWRLSDDDIPMICLDLGIHLYHLVYFLLEEVPLSTFATYNSYSKYNVIDDVNILTEHSKINGNLWMSKTSLGNKNGLSVEIYGSEGSAIWHQENPENLIIAKKNGDKVILDRSCEMIVDKNKLYNRMTPGHPAGYIESFANLYNDIANSLDLFINRKSYTSPYVYGFKHSLDAILFFDKCSASHKNHTWESL